MSRDVDEIVQQVKHRLPAVKVKQLWVKNPGIDDDGIWWFALPENKEQIQIESSHGICPFMIEHDDMKSTSEAETAASVEEAVEKIVTYLTNVQRRLSKTDS